MTAPSPPGKRVPAWPLVFLALPAAVAIWAGWVGLGGMTGFGEVQLLPGIWDDLRINTAITLPVGMEAYAAYAMRAWLTRGTPPRARRFARNSAVASLVLGSLGQIAYHLMAAAGIGAAPWVVTMLVSCIPVAVLGMGATLYHLLDDDPPQEQRAPQPAAAPVAPSVVAPFRAVERPAATAFTPAVRPAATISTAAAATGRTVASTAAERPAAAAAETTLTTAVVTPAQPVEQPRSRPAADAVATGRNEPVTAAVAAAPQPPVATADTTALRPRLNTPSPATTTTERPVEQPRLQPVTTAVAAAVVTPPQPQSTAAVVTGREAAAAAAVRPAEGAVATTDDRGRDRATAAQRPRLKPAVAAGPDRGRVTAQPAGNDRGWDLAALLPHAQRILTTEPNLGQRMLAVKLSEALGAEVPRYWAGQAKGRVEELWKQERSAAATTDIPVREVPRLARVAGS